METLARDALRQKFLAVAGNGQGPACEPYPGRAVFMDGRSLEEPWLHTNNSCNLACSHCLVSSGPDGDPGLPLDVFLEVIRQARAR